MIGDVVSVLALAVSVLAYLNSRRDKQPRLTVGVDVIDFEGTFDDRGYPDTPPMTVLFIDISNPSERRVKVVSAAIEVAGFIGPFAHHTVRAYYQGFQSRPEPPAFIVPGDNMGLSTEFDEFDNWIRNRARARKRLKYRAIAHDATGNSYFGNWNRLDR